MKATIHYRDKGWYEHNGLLDEELNRNIVGFICEGLFETITDIRPYQPIDNSCDENKTPDGQYMNCYLVMDIEPGWIADPEKHKGDINRTFYANLTAAPPKVTRHWTCGRESFFVVETSSSHPQVELDLDL